MYRTLLRHLHNVRPDEYFSISVDYDMHAGKNEVVVMYSFFADGESHSFETESAMIEHIFKSYFMRNPRNDSTVVVPPVNRVWREK